jgi:hypothetical protein
MDMGVEELISAAGRLHDWPQRAHRCQVCGRLVAPLMETEHD